METRIIVKIPLKHNLKLTKKMYNMETFIQWLNDIEHQIDFWKQGHAPEAATIALRKIPDSSLKLNYIVADGTSEETVLAKTLSYRLDLILKGKTSKDGSPIHIHMIEERTRPGRHFDYSNDP